MPNFDEISQTTAEIKLLPISENGRPPYWNSISCINIELSIVSEMSFCICLSNFVVIGRSTAELWSHIHLSRWRPAAILDLTWVMLEHLRLFLKFGLDPIYSVGDIAIFIFCRFGLKLPIHAHFLGEGWDIPPKWRHLFLTPKRHFLTRKYVVWAIKRKNRFSGSTPARSREKKWQGRTGQDRTVKKSHKVPIWGEAHTLSIKTKICMVGSLPDVITYAKFQVEIFRGYDFTGGRISHFLLIFAWALQQCSATALPVITKNCLLV